MLRTNTCGELTKKDTGKTVELSGWVHSRRDHGGIIFIDLRDHYGLTQIKFDPEKNKEAWENANNVRNEWVLNVKGIVIARPDNMINSKMSTGEVEIEVNEIKILNKSKVLPFEINEDKVKDAGEELRLKYRYLDLRKKRMQRNLIFRNRVTNLIRNYFQKNNFLDIETPCLIKNTPEGSREYMVPSRVHPGQFYVLPQSPQQLKQFLMLGGVDKYFQIARCFRDEDLRGDRQPEFTQFEIEMSFCEQKDIIEIMEKCFIEITKELIPDKKFLETPFPRMTWREAMITYGSDKPDIRYDLKIKSVTEAVKDCGFGVFADTVKNGGVVHALKVDGAGEKFTRKIIDELTEIAKERDAKGLAYIIVKEDEPQSPIVKFLGDDLAKKLMEEVEAKPGDIVFFGADKFITVCESLGAVRISCAERLEIIPEDILAYLWVLDFPLFTQSKETGQIAPEHHPFTRPLKDDIALLDNIDVLEKDPLRIGSTAFDVVLNGVELGGGSMRIHERDLQEKIFKTLKISDEDANRRFGHMLDAFAYGTPPHGGIAIGLDRFIMLLLNEPTIREVIAFPKDGKAKDLMLNAPSEVDSERLTELGIKTIKD